MEHHSPSPGLPNGTMKTLVSISTKLVLELPPSSTLPGRFAILPRPMLLLFSPCISSFFFFIIIIISMGSPPDWPLSALRSKGRGVSTFLSFDFRGRCHE